MPTDTGLPFHGLLFILPTSLHLPPVPFSLLAAAVPPLHVPIPCPCTRPILSLFLSFLVFRYAFRGPSYPPPCPPSPLLPCASTNVSCALALLSLFRSLLFWAERCYGSSNNGGFQSLLSAAERCVHGELGPPCKRGRSEEQDDIAMVLGSRFILRFFLKPPGSVTVEQQISLDAFVTRILAMRLDQEGRTIGGRRGKGEGGGSGEEGEERGGGQEGWAGEEEREGKDGDDATGGGGGEEGRTKAREGEVDAAGEREKGWRGGGDEEGDGVSSPFVLRVLETAKSEAAFRSWGPGLEALASLADVLPSRHLGTAAEAAASLLLHLQEKDAPLRLSASLLRRLKASALPGTPQPPWRNHLGGLVAAYSLLAPVTSPPTPLKDLSAAVSLPADVLLASLALDVGASGAVSAALISLGAGSTEALDLLALLAMAVPPSASLTALRLEQEIRSHPSRLGLLLPSLEALLPLCSGDDFRPLVSAALDELVRCGDPSLRPSALLLSCSPLATLPFGTPFSSLLQCPCSLQPQQSHPFTFLAPPPSLPGRASSTRHLSLRRRFYEDGNPPLHHHQSNCAAPVLRLCLDLTSREGVAAGRWTELPKRLCPKGRMKASDLHACEAAASICASAPLEGAERTCLLVSLACQAARAGAREGSQGRWGRIWGWASQELDGRLGDALAALPGKDRSTRAFRKVETHGGHSPPLRPPLPLLLSTPRAFSPPNPLGCFLLPRPFSPRRCTALFLSLVCLRSSLPFLAPLFVYPLPPSVDALFSLCACIPLSPTSNWLRMYC